MLVVLSIICLPRNAYADDFSRPELRILMNGTLLELSHARPVMIGDQPCIPLRYMSELLGAEVRWLSGSRRVLIKKDNKYMWPEIVLVEGLAYTKAGFFKEMFGLEIEYFKDYNVVSMSYRKLNMDQEQVLKNLPQYEGYSSEDLLWLSKIVEAEARGESYDSKLGVANVILNRVEYGAYPNTVKAVIFDRKNGVQFTPIMNGSVNNYPSDESVLAALDALEGKNNAGDALFFLNPRLATSTWVQNNREYAFTIGGHSYFY